MVKKPTHSIPAGKSGRRI